MAVLLTAVLGLGWVAPAALADTAEVSKPARFIDMKAGDRFFTAIDWMRESGLSRGITTPGGQEYRPKAFISREAMAAFLYREGAQPGYEPPSRSPFVDVPLDHQFYTEIAWMHEEGLTTGIRTPAGLSYAPKDRLSREAMAAFLYRYADPSGFAPPSTSPFFDVRTNHKFYRHIAWLHQQGIATGTCTPRGKEYLPYNRLTREAMAAFLYRQVLQRPATPLSCASPNLNSPGSITVVVNKKRALNPIRWAPSDLRRPSGVPNPHGQQLRSEAAMALERMYRAAQSAGRPFSITSGYRSYDTQSWLFNDYAARDGVAAAETYSARPGHSEHQLGLAVDVVDLYEGCGQLGCFGNTATARWLRDNAHRYGYIVRYNQGQQHIVGFIYEPWHLRYVGVDVATDMRARGYINLESYFGLPAAPRY